MSDTPRVSKHDESSHWYHRSGEACHQVPYADPKRQGEMKNTTVTEARKMGLLPSVTNIISLLGKPQLTAWQIEQAVLAAWDLRLDPSADIGYSDWGKKVVEGSKTIVKDAAQFGTRLMDAIEQFTMEGDRSDDPQLQPFLKEFIYWFEQNVEEVIWSEKTLVGDGYAGRQDAKWRIKDHGVLTLDVKTRKPEKQGSKRIRVYDEDKLQLCAYYEADHRIFHEDEANYPEPLPTGIASLLINSQEPCVPQLVVYKDEERERYWKAFQGLRDTWCSLKNHDPRTWV